MGFQDMVIPLEQRLKDTNVKGVIWAEKNMGKTYLVNTLPAKQTLFINLEHDDKSIKKDWDGLEVRPKTFMEFVELICWMANPSPTAPDDDVLFGSMKYSQALSKFGDKKQLQNVRCVFIDGLTKLSELAFTWAKQQPEVITKTGAYNGMKAYGLTSDKLIDVINHIHFNLNKHVFLTGLLSSKVGDDGSNIIDYVYTGQSNHRIDSIFDCILTLAKLPSQENPSILERVLVCSDENQYGYKSRNRGNLLAPIEQPNISTIIKKYKQK
ncbi:MAG: AAA family ATPase [Proteobacteria bacterium]|nr:AAA family ATPase [Pseudomonadota bacterium]